MIDTVMIYRSFWEAAQALPDKDRLAFWDAVIGYALDGVEPELSGMAKVAFILARPNIDSRNEMICAGKKGGRPKKETSERGVIENEKGGFLELEKGGFEKSKSKEEEEVEEEVKDIKKEIKERKRFVPPTVEEVKAYCDSRRDKGNKVNAEAFVAFYSSKNWMIGKNKMVDWKQAVITWEQKDKKQPVSRSGTTKPNWNIEKRDYDMEDLEAQLLRRSL